MVSCSRRTVCGCGVHLAPGAGCACHLCPAQAGRLPPDQHGLHVHQVLPHLERLVSAFSSHSHTYSHTAVKTRPSMFKFFPTWKGWSPPSHPTHTHTLALRPGLLCSPSSSSSGKVGLPHTHTHTPIHTPALRPGLPCSSSSPSGKIGVCSFILRRDSSYSPNSFINILL